MADSKEVAHNGDSPSDDSHHHDVEKAPGSEKIAALPIGEDLQVETRQANPLAQKLRSRHMQMIAIGIISTTVFTLRY